MDDLVSFLKARLDVAEQVARASKGSYWYPDGHSPEAIAFMNLFDEDAMLADIAAKREILDEYRLWADDDSRDYDQSQTAVDRTAALEEVVKLLAQPYAGHADFRSEWRREV